MDGFELTAALRRLPGYARTPIVIVSSKGRKVDKARGLEAGADEYVTKPFESEELVRVVMTLLG